MKTKYLYKGKWITEKEYLSISEKDYQKEEKVYNNIFSKRDFVVYNGIQNTDYRGLYELGYIGHDTKYLYLSKEVYNK